MHTDAYIHKHTCTNIETRSREQLAGNRWPSKDLTCVLGTRERVIRHLWPLSEQDGVRVTASLCGLWEHGQRISQKTSPSARPPGKGGWRGSGEMEELRPTTGLGLGP